MNVNNIIMIELHKMLITKMHMKGKNWIIKLEFIVKYQPPPEHVTVIPFVTEQ